MREGVMEILGGALVVLALLDVFLTVLYSRAGVGLLAPRLYRGTWALFKAVGRVAGRHKDAVLSFSGPAMMLLSVGMWFLLLLLGFSLIVWPALGVSVMKSSGTTPTDWWTAVYYTGYSLTTLGTGDLVPNSTFYRLLMVAKALVGFSIITLTLTYFMSVYSALVRRNTLAQVLHHLSGGTGDAVQLLARVHSSGWLKGGQGGFMDVGMQTLDLLESHHSYPVLHYFRMRDPRYSMARIALLVLEPLTLARSALAEPPGKLMSRAEISMLWGSGTDLLGQTGRSLLGAQALGQDDPVKRSRFPDAFQRLREAGFKLSDDQGKAEESYHCLRGQWVGAAYAFAEMMAHPWDEIEPPRAEKSGGQ